MGHTVAVVGADSICMVVANIWPSYQENQEEGWTDCSYIFIADNVLFFYVTVRNVGYSRCLTIKN